MNLILAVACSAAVSVMLRIGETHTDGMYGRFAMNYLCAAGLAMGVIRSGGNIMNIPDSTTLCMGALQGGLYVASFIVLQRSIGKNGVILSATFAKLGVTIPMLFSVLVFREMPSGIQWVGFLLACAAIWIIQTDGRKEKEAAGESGKLLLLLLLFASGVTDSMSKVFEEIGRRDQDAGFLLVTFIIALLVSVVLMVRSGERLRKNEILYGCLVGIPNYGSVYFLLKALAQFPAILIYPAYSVGTILAVSLVGVAVFKEIPGIRKWTGMAVTLLALILLNM